jgi:SAM-dependent methyltransferase
MPDDISDIREYYNGYADKESDRLERHQQEHDITWRYLEQYLPKSGRILEIGAAVGGYTIPLAKKGYQVTAVDISPGMLEICRQKVVAEGLDNKITCVEADGRDLSAVTGRNFDAVLLMGPLYHLVEKADRRQTLTGAAVRLKKGGVIFSTFINRYGIWGDSISKNPGEIELPGVLKSIFEKGSQNLPPESRGKAFRAYFANPAEVVPFHRRAGFKKLVLAGMEPLGTIGDVFYNKLEGNLKNLWTDLLFSISTEKSLIGASCHLLYVGIKE